MTGVCFCTSDFSVGESILKVDNIVKIAKEKGYSAISLCDTMTLSSMIIASQACDNAQVKLIAGVRLRIVEDPSVKDSKQNNRAWYPKLMFKNEKGLKIAYKLLTKSFAEENFYYVPRLSFSDLLEAITDDVVVTLGDQNSNLGSQLTEERVQMLINKIGKENVFAECVPMPTPVFDRLAYEAIKLNQKFGISLLYTDLCQYPDSKGKNALIALHAIAGKGDSLTIKSSMVSKPTYDTAYIKTPEEYIELCKQQMNRVKERYNIDTEALKKALQFSFLEFEKLFEYKWHALKPCLPQMAEDPFEKLKELCKQGFATKLNKEVFGYKPKPEDLPKYVERLKYELDIIKQMDFANYFLLVKDILGWADANGLGGGEGRGSSGGSLVAYLLDIVQTDPIRFGLMFERFINPNRHDLPDVDMDISSLRRQELIAHINSTYGVENVAAISNYITLGAAGAIRACGRVFGLNIGEYACSSKVPSEHGNTYSLEEARNAVPEISLFADKYPELWETAKQLEGCITTYGVHAAGLIVAGEPIENRAAIEARSGGRVVCWDKTVVESMGLIKMDLLGLITLDVLSYAKRYIKDFYGEEFDNLSIRLDDKETLDMFSKGKSSGVFQFETAGGLLKRVGMAQPLTFEDVVAISALNRPGPMDSGMLDDFIAIKQGLKDVFYEYPKTKPILERTYGLMVYQEQIMQIAVVLAGFTAGEADNLRKAIAKKKLDKLKVIKEQWVKGCENTSGLTAYQAENLWSKIEKFGGYGFNLSHAVAYTLLSYTSMYIKAHYPAAFYAAALSVLPEQKLRNIVKNAEEAGITLLPPDINLAGDSFRIIDEHHIMIPFNRVKGLGPTATQAILTTRAEGKFTSVDDFYKRVPGKCNSRHKESLQKIGAFASLDSTQASSTDISRLKDQYELLPELIIKTLKTTKKAIPPEIKKELVNAIAKGQQAIEAVGKKFVKPQAGRCVRYVAITDAPTQAEVALGKFTAPRSFEGISYALQTSGVLKEEGYWTGLMKTSKENKAEITKEEFILNLPILQRELQLLKPEVIVLLGGESIRYFAKDIAKPSEAIGQSFYSAEYDATFVIGFNPSMLFFKPEKQAELNEVFAKVNSIIH